MRLCVRTFLLFLEYQQKKCVKSIFTEKKIGKRCEDENFGISFQSRYKLYTVNMADNIVVSFPDL